MQHTFLVHLFAVVCTTTKLNVQKRPGYTLMEEMSYKFLFTFFSIPLIFSWVAGSISHFLTAATNSRCSSNKKMAPYLSLLLSVALFLVELCLPVVYFLFFSVFLFHYIPNLWT